MEVSAYKDLLDIMLAGAGHVFDIKALLAFVLCLAFVYTASKNEDAHAPSADLFWTSASTMFTFTLASVALFALSTPLTIINMTDVVAGSFSLFAVISMTSVVILLALAWWLFLPAKPAQKSFNHEDDDLAVASILAVPFGVALSAFVFLGVEWPKELLAQALSPEIIQQGAFYGFAYMFGFACMWAVGFVGIYALVGRLFACKIPAFIGGALLIVAALYQAFSSLP